MQRMALAFVGANGRNIFGLLERRIVRHLIIGEELGAAQAIIPTQARLFENMARVTHHFWLLA